MYVINPFVKTIKIHKIL